MTRASIVILILLVVNAVLGGWTVIQSLKNQAFLQKSVRAQAWILWDSGAVDFSRRDMRYDFMAPVPASRDEFAEFVLMDSVKRQDRALVAAMVWLAVSSVGLLNVAAWSAVRGKRAVRS